MQVISWNVWGLGSSVKRKEIRMVLWQQRAEMVFLIETKLELLSESLIKSIWWTDSFRYVFSPSVGLSCGIIIMLKDWKCGMLVTYVPCGVMEQVVCWQSLSALIVSCDVSVCCGGDFNAVFLLAERRNCLGDRRGMAAFLEFVEEVGLLDLSASGCKFSWYGGDSKVIHLDRFLVSASWIEKFVVQHNLSHSVSDHLPVRLSSSVFDWGPRPFRSVDLQIEVTKEFSMIWISKGVEYGTGGFSYDSALVAW
ncbi:hypothetical protein V6N13_139958 [Hibiscus sabdariffa]